MKKNVAVVGCGNISGIYLKNLTEVFSNTQVYAVCDLDEEKRNAAAEKYNAKIMTFDEILSDDNVDIVLNITTPKTHYSLCKKILLAKKSAYVEKPLSLTYEQGKELSELADINRSTFYTHYCDIYAVAEEMAEEFIRHIPFSAGEIKSTAKEIEKSFDYFRKNKDLCIALLKNGYYKKYLLEKAKRIFEDGTLQNGKMIGTDEKIYLAMSAYTCSGMESFLLFCLENDVDIPNEYCGKFFYDIDEYCKNAVIYLSGK